MLLHGFVRFGTFFLTLWPMTQFFGGTYVLMSITATVYCHIIHSSGSAFGRLQSFDVPFSLLQVLRPRHGPVRNSPLTLVLVLYVYRA